MLENAKIIDKNKLTAGHVMRWQAAYFQLIRKHGLLREDKKGNAPPVAKLSPLAPTANHVFNIVAAVEAEIVTGIDGLTVGELDGAPPWQVPNIDTLGEKVSGLILESRRPPEKN